MGSPDLMYPHWYPAVFHWHLRWSCVGTGRPAAILPWRRPSTIEPIQAVGEENTETAWGCGVRGNVCLTLRRLLADESGWNGT